VIFDARTLKILGQISVAKDLYPEFATWHGNGRVVLATQSAPNTLAIYELPDR
jgi:hypothetical protein